MQEQTNGCRRFRRPQSGRQSKYWTREDPEAFPRGRESSDTGSLERQSKCWTQEDRDGLQRKLQQLHREGLPRIEEHRGLPRKQGHLEGWPRKQEHLEGWPRKLAQEDRDGWPRKLAQEDRDGWPRKLAQEDRDGWPRKLAQEDRDGWPRKLAQEDRDGLPRIVAKFDAGTSGRQSKRWAHEHCGGRFGKFLGYRVNLKRERAELREGLPGKIEKVVTHEGKEVEKIVKGSRRVDGVLWMHQSHVATRRSHMRQSNMAKQFHPVMQNMHKLCCIVDRRFECETRILNHGHVCSLFSLETHKQQWALRTRVRHGRDLCV